MLKYIALLSFISLTFSCRDQKKQPPNYAELIKGDWIGKEKLQENRQTQTAYLLIDDTVIRRSVHRFGLKYQIKEDTLIVEDFNDDKKVHLRYFHIAKLTNDSFICTAGRYQQDSFQYVKLQPKNNITPAAIYFGYEGPVEFLHSRYYIEIDSLRNVRFWGIRDSSTKQGYKGTLTEKAYNSIVSSIRKLPADSLKLIYVAPWQGDQTMGVSIVYGDKVIRSATYGHYREPMELYFLLNQLSDLNWQVKMQPDPSLTKDYFERKISVLPVTTPPPPALRKEE
ncbi:hypothetical protein [Niastella populi]|uniref:DUF6438 domain-containing protein n=1 Tax=Niastella populi TaxID=550983 RepID=A0A1V9EKR6_9BACT|nr:hypothetical protein [Niastella populi]OQP46747.1 hypothetical protein A4R26_08530 [Niastella populi]